MSDQDFKDNSDNPVLFPEEEKIDSLWTLENAEKKFGPDELLSGEKFEIYWSLGQNQEEMTLLFKEQENEGYHLRLMQIHMDAIKSGSWEDLDWHCIQEIFFEMEELDKFKEFMED